MPEGVPAEALHRWTIIRVRRVLGSQPFKDREIVALEHHAMALELSGAAREHGIAVRTPLGFLPPLEQCIGQFESRGIVRLPAAVFGPCPSSIPYLSMLASILTSRVSKSIFPHLSACSSPARTPVVAAN